MRYIVGGRQALAQFDGGNDARVDAVAPVRMAGDDTREAGGRKSAAISSTS